MCELYNCLQLQDLVARLEKDKDMSRDVFLMEMNIPNGKMEKEKRTGPVLGEIPQSRFNM